MLIKDMMLPCKKIRENRTLAEVWAFLDPESAEILVVTDENEEVTGVLTAASLAGLELERFSPELEVKQLASDDFQMVDEDLEVDIDNGIDQSFLIATGADGEITGAVSKQKAWYCLYKLAAKELTRLEGILDWSHNGIIAVDAEGIVTFMNHAAEEIIWRRREESIGKHLSDVIIPLGLLEVLKTGEKQLAHKFSVHYSRGSRIYMTHRTPIWENDKIVGAVGVFQDISEIEAIADELDVVKQLNKELETIIEASYDGMLVADSSGEILRENKAFERLMSLKDIDAEKLKETISQKIVPRVFKTNQRSFDVIESEARQLLVTANPVYESFDEVERIILNVRDLTELNSLKKALQESRKLSERYHSELSQITNKYSKEGIVVASEPMEKVLSLASRVAIVDSTVLIQGESGTGKENIANIIHRLSKRKDGPFIKVNCGAIPENLLESELFGYEPGAFTGASKSGKVGLFELANDGTLFLDEIGELPLQLQVKLLRALQEKEFFRIGGEQSHKFDARILAASNRNLDEMVKEGTFREDLFFRLNVVPIYVPPLRERKEDIVPLIKHFQKKFAAEYELDKEIAPQTMEYLLDYSWPGNVRELINIIERLMVIVPGSVVMPEDLPGHIIEGGTQNGIISVKGILPLKNAVEEVERQVISSAIERYGSTYKAAKALNVDQSTVVRKMNRLKINK